MGRKSRGALGSGRQARAAKEPEGPGKLLPGRPGPSGGRESEPTDEADQGTIGPEGAFVEFSFIRGGWTKKKPSFSLFAPDARRCSSCAAAIFVARSIATWHAVRKVGRERGGPATPATKEVRKVASITATDRAPIGAEKPSRHA